MDEVFTNGQYRNVQMDGHMDKDPPFNETKNL